MFLWSTRGLSLELWIHNSCDYYDINITIIILLLLLSYYYNYVVIILLLSYNYVFIGL